MSSFDLTKKAKEDLRKIAKYTELNWGKIKRNLYIKQFDDSFHLLAETPLIGIECDNIQADYKKFPQGSHILFYKIITKDKINVIRILHKRMDVKSIFS